MLFRVLIVAAVGLAQANAIAKETPAPAVLPANNSVAVRKAVGTTATVRGRVQRASISKSGHHFLNFYSSDLTVVCFKEHLRKFKKGPAEQFKGKEVEITGRVEDYKGRPQIKLTTPDQIRLVDERAVKQKSSIPDTKDSPSKPGGNTSSLDDDNVGKSIGSKSKKKFELKQIGKTSWLSPAGLRYVGKDAEGLTRVDHVLRHAADQPRRAGPHGVFDGGRDGALATVDEAWKLARKKKLKPRRQGATSAYTIPMGRRVGYLGGQLGTSKRNPPLRSVFIVVRAGTSNVVTAFPK